MRQWIELSVRILEALAAAILVGSIIFGSLRFLLDLWKRVEHPFRTYKELLGRALLLALEILVAADVIGTVAVDLSPRNLGVLAGLVVIRTFLSWCVVVENEGRWPWQRTASSSERFDWSTHV